MLRARGRDISSGVRLIRKLSTPADEHMPQVNGEVHSTASPDSCTFLLFSVRPSSSQKQRVDRSSRSTVAEPTANAFQAQGHLQYQEW